MDGGIVSSHFCLREREKWSGFPGCFPIALAACIHITYKSVAKVRVGSRKSWPVGVKFLSGQLYWALLDTSALGRGMLSLWCLASSMALSSAACQYPLLGGGDRWVTWGMVLWLPLLGPTLAMEKVRVDGHTFASSFWPDQYACS